MRPIVPHRASNNLRVFRAHVWICFDQRKSRLPTRPLAYNTRRMVFFQLCGTPLCYNTTWQDVSMRVTFIDYFLQNALIHMLKNEVLLSVWPSHRGCQAVVIESIIPVRCRIYCQNWIWNNNPRSLTMSHGNPLYLKQLGHLFGHTLVRT